jgi:ATP-dependent DNA helicase RecQ
LRDIRKKAAGRFGQTEQLICKEEMLRTLTAEKPAAKNELLAIPGFSVKMFNKIGEEFLTAIKDFIEKHPSEKKDETAQQVSDIPENLIPAYNLLLEGSSLSEISDRLKLQPPVISMQIETILQYKPNTSIDSLFDREKIKQISAVPQDGITDIKTIKRRLPDEISYPEIRIVLAKEVKSRKSNL